MSQIDRNRGNTVPDDIRRDMSDKKYQDGQGGKLLDVLLESDPPTFKGSVDEMHKVYAWPGKRTPIIKCLWVNKWFSTWIYHGQKLTCFECFRPIGVNIVKRGKRGGA